MADLGGPNTLLWHRTSLTGTFDLNLAHPGGVAKLLSGRPTLLSELVRAQVRIACVDVRRMRPALIPAGLIPGLLMGATSANLPAIFVPLWPRARTSARG